MISFALHVQGQISRVGNSNRAQVVTFWQVPKPLRVGFIEMLPREARYDPDRMFARLGQAVVFPAILAVLGLSPALYAEDGGSGKPPYNVFYGDFGFGHFGASSSSTTVPTQDCSKVGNLVVSKTCAEGLSGTPTIDFGGGIRPKRYFQGGFTLNILGDVGRWGTGTDQYQCVSGCTGTYTRKITTRSLLVTTDARFVLPLLHDRLLVSAGGGLGWLDITQKPQSVGNEQFQGCSVCQSRQGHGPTEVIEVVYLPDKLFGFGVHYRSVQITSPGFSSVAGFMAADPFGLLVSTPQSVTYKDRFSVIGGSITFRLPPHRH
jgi:hypothetical protein